MLAKYWKKIGMLILIIACLINVMAKLVNKVSLNEELKASIIYLYTQQINQDQNQEKNNE